MAGAALLSYVTFIGSVGRSCGAYDTGPNPGAEAAFCGYRSGEAIDYSALFLLVQFLPALPALAGGAMACIGRSRRLAAAGLAVGVLTTVLIWVLEP
jgi:hypothetical protein